MAKTYTAHVRHVATAMSRSDARLLEQLASRGWAIPDRPQLRPHVLAALDALDDRDAANRIRSVVHRLNDNELAYLISDHREIQAKPRRRRL